MPIPKLKLAPLMLLLMLPACELAMRDDILRPALTDAVADPVVLAHLCKTTPEKLGPVSRSKLTIEVLQGTSHMLSSQGIGSATLAYTPLSGTPKQCRGRATFDFDDGGGKVHAGTLSIHNLKVSPNVSR